MSRTRGRVAVALAVVGLAGGSVIVGCSSGGTSSSPSPSPSHSTSHAPGGLSSRDLTMTEPSGENRTSTVTGSLLNNGEPGSIVKATSPAAKSVKLMQGSKEVKSIPIPTSGAQASQSLTAKSYHVQLENVDMNISPGATISLYLITDRNQESMIMVRVAEPAKTTSPKPKKS